MIEQLEVFFGRLAAKLRCRRLGHNWSVEGRTVRRDGAICKTCSAKLSGEAAMDLWRQSPETDADVLNTHGIGESGLDNYAEWPPAEPVESPTEKMFKAKMAVMMRDVDWSALPRLQTEYLETLEPQYQGGSLSSPKSVPLDGDWTLMPLRAAKPTDDPHLSNPVGPPIDSVLQAARNFAVRDLCHEVCAKRGVFFGGEIMAFTAYVFEHCEGIIILHGPEGSR